MGQGLFGHMGLHQWGHRETKLGGETKAQSLSLSLSLSPPAMAGRPRKHPDQGHPLPASQRVSQLVWLTGITQGSTAQCDANPGTAQAAPPCPASRSAAMGAKNKSLLVSLFPAVFTFWSHCRTELQVG